MKRKITKDFLAESFIELVEKRPVAKITITDITDNCEYSQPTFYNHFKDKYDLIAWIARNNAQKIISENDDPEGDPKEIISGIISSFIKSIKDNQKVMFNIVSHILSDENLYRQIANVYVDVIWENMKEKEAGSKLSEDVYKVLQTYFYGISIQVAHWLIDGMPYPEEEIQKTIKDTIPEKLKGSTIE